MECDNAIDSPSIPDVAPDLAGIVTPAGLPQPSSPPPPGATFSLLRALTGRTCRATADHGAWTKFGWGRGRRDQEAPRWCIPSTAVSQGQRSYYW